MRSLSSMHLLTITTLIVSIAFAAAVNPDTTFNNITISSKDRYCILLHWTNPSDLGDDLEIYHIKFGNVFSESQTIKVSSFRDDHKIIPTSNIYKTLVKSENIFQSKLGKDKSIDIVLTARNKFEAMEVNFPLADIKIHKKIVPPVVKCNNCVKKHNKNSIRIKFDEFRDVAGLIDVAYVLMTNIAETENIKLADKELVEKIIGPTKDIYYKIAEENMETFDNISDWIISLEDNEVKCGYSYKIVIFFNIDCGGDSITINLPLYVECDDTLIWFALGILFGVLSAVFCLVYLIYNCVVKRKRHCNQQQCQQYTVQY